MSFDDLIEPSHNARKMEYRVDPAFAPFYEKPPPGGVPSFARAGAMALFLDAIDRGVSLKAACNRIGVHAQNWWFWEKQADAVPDGAHAFFVTQVRQKLAEVEVELVDAFRSTIEIATEAGDHRPVLSFLERWNPDSWGPATRSKQEITLNVADDTDDVLRRLLPEAFAGGTAGEDGAPST